MISTEIIEEYYMSINSLPRVAVGADRVNAEAFERNKQANFEVIQKKVKNGSYKFTRLKSIHANSRKVYIPTIRDRIVIDLLKDTIKSKYRVKYYNREHIIKSIIGKLKSGMPFFIVRLDIKKFFPNIPQQKLLEKLKSSSLLSFEEYNLTKDIIKLAGNKGIPQGLSISNVLSELYLETFDRSFQRIHPRVNYYFRFVDDIILMINGQMANSEIENLKRNIQATFSSHGLKINHTKESYINFSIKNPNQQSFDYLGYRFEARQKKLCLSISENKLKLIYDRIDSCFRMFEKDPNFELLSERLKNLTSKKRAKKTVFFFTKKAKLAKKTKQYFFGALESYKEIDGTHEVWQDLDRYIRTRLRIYRHAGLIRSRSELRLLQSYSFSRFANSDEIYKIDKLTKDQLVEIHSRINQNIPSHYWSNFSYKSLLKRYVEMVTITE